MDEDQVAQGEQYKYNMYTTGIQMCIFQDHMVMTHGDE